MMPYILIVLAVVARLLVHPFNFTPIGGIGLFAGAWCPPRIAWVLPLVALLLSDIITGLYNPVVMVFVYLGFLSGPLFGWLLLSRRRSLPRFGLAVMLAAVSFFVVSNFGMWLSGIGPYPPTVAGLFECYVAGLPFLRVSLIGDLFYGGLLFVAAELAQKLIANYGGRGLAAG